MSFMPAVCTSPTLPHAEHKVHHLSAFLVLLPTRRLGAHTQQLPLSKYGWLKKEDILAKKHSVQSMKAGWIPSISRDYLVVKLLSADEIKRSRRKRKERKGGGKRKDKSKPKKEGKRKGKGGS